MTCEKCRFFHVESMSCHRYPPSFRARTKFLTTGGRRLGQQISAASSRNGPRWRNPMNRLSLAVDIIALVLAVTVALGVCSYAAYRHGEQAGYKQAQAELMVGRVCK